MKIIASWKCVEKLLTGYQIQREKKKENEKHEKTVEIGNTS